MYLYLILNTPLIIDLDTTLNHSNIFQDSSTHSSKPVRTRYGGSLVEVLCCLESSEASGMDGVALEKESQSWLQP